MAITATAIWRVRVGGNSANGAGFDPALVTVLTDLTATSGTTASPVVSSTTRPFTSADEGAYLFIKSGSSWLPGWYPIASVNAGAATLNAAAGAVRAYTTDVTNSRYAMELTTTIGCATTSTPSGGTFAVDYSQQDAAELSLSDVACSASTTVTSATGGFTKAMVGNAIRITGTGVTSGYYFITAQTDTNTITVDRNPAAGATSGGTGKVGGAADLPERVCAYSVGGGTVRTAGDTCVAGNFIYIRGNGSDRPSTTDYLNTNYVSIVGGTRTAGRVSLIGENGRPRISVINGSTIFDAGTGSSPYGSYNLFRDIYFFSPAATIYNRATDVGPHSQAENCIFDGNNQNQNCVYAHFSSSIRNCEVFSHISTPTTNTNANGIYCTVGHYQKVIGCYIHHCGNYGISGNSSSGLALFAIGNLLSNNVAGGIYLDAYYLGVSASSVIANNVFYTCPYGIRHDNDFDSAHIYNNVFVGCVTEGLSVITGSNALDSIKALVDYNAFYNNGLHVSGISHGPHDVICTADPFRNAAGLDFRLNNTAGGGLSLQTAGFPQKWPGT